LWRAPPPFDGLVFDGRVFDLVKFPEIVTSARDQHHSTKRLKRELAYFSFRRCPDAPSGLVRAEDSAPSNVVSLSNTKHSRAAASLKEGFQDEVVRLSDPDWIVLKDWKSGKYWPSR
jgi:hypothetical protein